MMSAAAVHHAVLWSGDSGASSTSSSFATTSPFPFVGPTFRLAPVLSWPWALAHLVDSSVGSDSIFRSAPILATGASLVALISGFSVLHKVRAEVVISCCTLRRDWQGCLRCVSNLPPRARPVRISATASQAAAAAHVCRCDDDSVCSYHLSVDMQDIESDPQATAGRGGSICSCRCTRRCDEHALANSHSSNTQDRSYGWRQPGSALVGMPKEPCQICVKEPLHDTPKRHSDTRLPQLPRRRNGSSITSALACLRRTHPCRIPHMWAQSSSDWQAQFFSGIACARGLRLASGEKLSGAWRGSAPS